MGHEYRPLGSFATLKRGPQVTSPRNALSLLLMVQVGALTQYGTSRNSNADDIDPAMGEIEQVAIEQGAHDILHNNHQPSP
jgi:hypothetical protein